MWRRGQIFDVKYQGDKAWVVKSGFFALGIIPQPPDKNKTILEIFAQGDIFASQMLLGRIVWCLSDGDIEEIILTNPELLDVLIRQYLRNLEIKKIIGITSRRRRLNNFIDWLEKNYPQPPALTHEDIGAYLAMSEPSVTNNLKALKLQGLITEKGFTGTRHLRRKGV